ncbi:hypothetical protein C0Q70_14738 [Pomacea canaliculata]|uniref:Uncharacterized protein n=1 Tax=Pomacea canaliculata TaxID=400727 RepID=A0A2T7NSW1_POMCA|nr:hypothetical protein C0Q70_14738 [Pomacea canaliculata]
MCQITELKEGGGGARHPHGVALQHLFLPFGIGGGDGAIVLFFLERRGPEAVATKTKRKCARTQLRHVRNARDGSPN